MENFECIIEKDIEKYFKRKYVKKLLFTTKYNIGSKKAFKNFLDEIGFIEDKEMFKKIASTFQKIYLNLVKGVIEEKILYKNSLKELNNKLKKEEYFQLEDISVNLTYHKSIKREINIFENGERFTLSNYETSKEVDYDKIKIWIVNHYEKLNEICNRMKSPLEAEFNQYSIDSSIIIGCEKLRKVGLVCWRYGHS
jgi:hypothetical protein